MIFCTLFDSNYLDKGIVLIESLERVCRTLKIYVLAMDQKCFEILTDIKKARFESVTIINETDFVSYEELENEKNNRSRAEYCWTCTAHLIDYVINYYSEAICTYVDADMYFYDNPDILIDEMKEKTVQIVEHRFTNSPEDQISKKQSGTYCVEFNTFTSDKESLELLQWWKDRCRESCSNLGGDSKVFGDQMYLEDWGEKAFVSILKNKGGGVAPWNVSQYRLISYNGDKIVFRDKKKDIYNLIFYHFHNLSYIENRLVDISVYQRNWGVDDKFINAIYTPYLRKLDEAKQWLKKKYELDILITKHPAFTARDNKKMDNNTESKSKEHHLLLSIYLIINSKLKKALVEKKNLVSF